MGTREGYCLGIGLHCRRPEGQMGSGRWGQSFLRELPWAGRKLLDAQWLRKELEVATYIER